MHKECKKTGKHLIDPNRLAHRWLGNWGKTGDKYVGLQNYCERCNTDVVITVKNPHYIPRGESK